MLANLPEWIAALAAVGSLIVSIVALRKANQAIKLSVHATTTVNQLVSSTYGGGGGGASAPGGYATGGGGSNGSPGGSINVTLPER